MVHLSSPQKCSLLDADRRGFLPNGGVREAPPPIFTVFEKIRAGLLSACRRDLGFCTKASAEYICRPCASPLALKIGFLNHLEKLHRLPINVGDVSDTSGLTRNHRTQDLLAP